MDCRCHGLGHHFLVWHRGRCHELWRQRRRALNPRLECSQSSREWLAKVEMSAALTPSTPIFPSTLVEFRGPLLYTSTPSSPRHLAKNTRVAPQPVGEESIHQSLLLGHPHPRPPFHLSLGTLRDPSAKTTATRPLLPVIRPSST